MHGLGVTQTNFDNLWLLVVITNLSTLLPLPFLNWLPNTSASGDGEFETPSTSEGNSANSVEPIAASQ
jgi:hypothetical protein